MSCWWATRCAARRARCLRSFSSSRAASARRSISSHRPPPPRLGGGGGEEADCCCWPARRAVASRRPVVGRTARGRDSAAAGGATPSLSALAASWRSIALAAVGPPAHHEAPLPSAWAVAKLWWLPVLAVGAAAVGEEASARLLMRCCRSGDAAGRRADGVTKTAERLALASAAPVGAGLLSAAGRLADGTGRLADGAVRRADPGLRADPGCLREDVGFAPRVELLRPRDDGVPACLSRMALRSPGSRAAGASEASSCCCFFGTLEGGASNAACFKFCGPPKSAADSESSIGSRKGKCRRRRKRSALTQTTCVLAFSACPACAPPAAVLWVWLPWSMQSTPLMFSACSR